MSDKTPATDDEAREGWERFRQLARALIRVDKRDVPKHEPKRRDVNRTPETTRTE